MKLSAVHIQNFRSVKDAIVEDIDDFNVFIGKTIRANRIFFPLFMRSSGSSQTDHWYHHSL